jgi:hypothetical protein
MARETLRIDCGGCHRDVDGQLEMGRAISLIRKVSRSIAVGQLQSTYGLYGAAEMLPN